jgi:hypothetical protein
MVCKPTFLVAAPVGRPRRAWRAAAIAIALCVPTAGLGQVPRVISHQGVLTQPGGAPVPDQAYDLMFRLYDAPGGGSPLFVEAHAAVPVTGGRYQVILGAITPLTLPFDDAYWVGVQVGSDAEMSPRLALTSAPYTLALALPFRGRADGPEPAVRITNTSGGLALDARRLISVEGAATSSARVELDEVPGLRAAAEWIMDESGQFRAGFFHIEDIAAGSSASSLEANRGSPETGFVMVREWSGIDDSYFALAGDAGTTYLSLSDVVLPPNSLSSSEIHREPGVSSDGDGSSTSIGTTATTIGSVVAELSTWSPSPLFGFVYLSATCEITLQHVFGTSSSTRLKLADAPGGGGIVSEYVEVGLAASAPSGTYRLHTPLSRLYRTNAGSHQFYLLGQRTSGTSTAEDWQISVMYIPFEYGFTDVPITGPAGVQGHVVAPDPGIAVGAGR